ncbi:hypothetical protein GCM10011581_18850 [Saccharopolyspora subtropica]|uniref:Glycosyltransferase RgtA/B/C/D-like domain-containing protein n=1 Tax=Saccharopolyspora thermophila TaxID=89367 RepID=A0A917JTN1_9PSEU|nr:glycosyltransferase family 87 protein [Saccharopolyspora subtropica]GGI81629.1 hypothetical protein GCM10011581_18850 [Saccharopolyspora subtropica]
MFVSDGMAADRPRWSRYGWSAGVAAVLSAGLFWLVRGSLIDDSYITLSYARNLAFYGHWGLITAEVSNSATAPLNVLVLAAVTAVVRHPVLALGIVFVLANVALAVFLHATARASGLPGWIGPLGALLVAANPLLLSTVGLEMTLASALLGMLLFAAVRRRYVLFGVAAGLLALTRLDLGVFVLAVLIGRPGLWRGWWRWLLAAAVTALPWFVFSWFYFGSAVPDTLVIKQVQRSWGDWDFHNGLQLYHQVFPTAVVISLVPAVLGLVCLVGLCVLRLFRRAARVWPWALIGLGAVAHYYVYTLMGVPPYHWYYGPSLIGLTVLLVGGVGLLASRRLVVPAVLAGCAVFGAQGWFALQHGLPWREAAITTNWATSADYARIGAELGRVVGTGTVASPGEIGALAYFCDCAIVDTFSDRGYLAAQLEKRLADASPLTRALLELNYRHFQPTEPLRVDYVLRREPGPGPDPLWRIGTTWAEPAHLALLPGEPEPETSE